ncbi:TIGR02677 family protein, partial [Streptomyces sp. NPDC007251]
MEAPTPGAAQNAATQDVQNEARRRLDAYTYLSAPERLEHLAIMRVFCGTLLADLAVPDLLAKLRQAGGPAAGLD